MLRIACLPFVAALIFFAFSGCTQPVEEIPATQSALVDDLPAVEPSESDWPWWRGPERNGHAEGPQPPTEWAPVRGDEPAKNILWKTPITGQGHASPVVWGDRIFVATSDAAAKTQSLVCLDRDGGEILWTQEIHRGQLAGMHSKNTHASATPACDGERVFMTFATSEGVIVTALDFDGKIIWQKRAGPFAAQHGFGSSPVIYQSLVIVNGDNRGSGFLAALHRETGQIVWRVQRPGDDSYATPIVAEVAGRWQLLLSGQERVVSYDPSSGDVLWTCDGPADTTANTMAFDDEHVYASGGYPERGVMCISADGAGDVTDTHVKWKRNFKVYVPSLLVMDDRLICVGDDGVARCLAKDDGREIWKERLGGSYSASPVLAGGLVYVPSERGTTVVFQPGDEFELVAKNDLGDGGFASPVIVDGRIYLRTRQYLYCIGR